MGSPGVWPTRFHSKNVVFVLAMDPLRFCNCSIVGSIGIWPTRVQRKNVVLFAISFLLWAICDVVIAPSWAHVAFGPLVLNTNPMLCVVSCYGTFAFLLLLHRGLTWLLAPSRSIIIHCVLLYGPFATL